MGRRGLAICLGVWGAIAFAAAPAAAQPVSLTPNPALGQALATDGLMDPTPAVPPRRAYQRPMAQPDEGDLPRAARDPLDTPLPDGAAIPLAATPGRFFRFVPRYGRLNNFTSEKLPDGTQRAVITGGVIVYVSPGAGKPEIEFATDDAVVWVRGTNVDNIAGGFEAAPETPREVEVYLSGNVIIRTTSAKVGGAAFTQTLRAERVYYDVSKNRAIALAGDLELANPRVPDGVHLTGREIRQLDLENWEVLKGSAFSTKLPADPGVRVDSPKIGLHERQTNLTNIFGIPYRDFDGNTVAGTERQLTVRNAVTRINGVPVFYWPYIRTDLTEPLGPFTGIGGGQDRIFGTQIYTNWDMYKLLALRPPPGHQWKLDLDYLSYRGPAIGTDYTYSLPIRPDELVSPGRGYARLYGITDSGGDVLGGFRGPEPGHPTNRGRALWQHQQEILSGMYFQGQFDYLSDQNFLEQYFKQEFDLGPSQETFAYLTYQHQNLWSSALVLPKVGQNWMTRTEWLPRVDGAIVGQSFWDILVYNARANAGYAQLDPSTVNPLPVLATDRATNTARLDLNQELSLPFDLGPVKFAPYGVLDLAYYSKDLTGRVYGGGGVRTNLPLSRLYESAASELFNVHGLYHKTAVSTNYFYAQSNVPFAQLPLLDRLDDDTTDYTYRYARTYVSQYISGPAGLALSTSPLYNQQLYAIRRLVDNRVDTLGDVNVLQMDVRQRFQTKRGYPGLEHTVDWLRFDLSGSYFPQANRDNFGKSFAFLEYNALWNMGDRASVLSSGWFDPFDFGTRYWNLGFNLDRPDRTNFYVGYRQTDPLNSKAVTASFSYQMSRRYYTSLGASYDFGIQTALTNSLGITRTGSDVTISVGFTYNALVNNFGFNFLIVPNIIQALAPGSFQSFSR